jgi:hypothetical protein
MTDKLRKNDAVEINAAPESTKRILMGTLCDRESRPGWAVSGTLFLAVAHWRLKDSYAPPWILEPSATGLCKPDLNVFAKLLEDCLKRGLEAQVFSGRAIGLVGHFVDVGLTG